MPDLSDSVNWSEVDANNNRPSPNGWPEGMMPSGVNDTGRANKGALKRFWDRINPVQTITPSGGVYTFTTSNAAYPTAYITGEVYCFKTAINSIGGDSFQVNALGTKPIWKRIQAGWTSIINQDIASGVAVQLVYDATLNAGVGAFILLNPFVPISGNGAGGVSIPGGLTVTGGQTVSVDLMLSGTDAAYHYILRPNTAGYNNLAFAAAGAAPLNDVQIITTTMVVTGLLSTRGYRSRSGVNGAYQGNYYNIQWDGSQAHLWVDNSDIGPIITGSTGSVVIGGNVSAGSITSSGNVSAGSITCAGNISASGSINSSADVTAAGNFRQNGNYHYFAGSGGNINTTGGPLIYGDVNAIVLKPGNGTIGVEFQNYAGTNTLVVSNSGNMTVAGTINAGGNITTAHQLVSTGSDAAVGWDDRSNSSLRWLWYTTGGIARLWNSTSGDRVTIDSSGNFAANNVYVPGTGPGGVSIRATQGAVQSDISGTAFYAPNGNVVCQSVTVAGSGTAYYAPNGNVVCQWVTAAGSISLGDTLTIGTNQGGSPFPALKRSGNYNVFSAWDIAVGTNNGCIMLGNSGDLTHYYRNNQHYFQSWNGVATLAAFNNTNCFKPGGGSWGDTSDIRLKHHIEDYTSGLAVVDRLRPVRYRFNGRGGTTDDGRVFTGLIADEVQDVMPEMVGTLGAKLDPEDDHDTDILTLDATSLIYALVNSVKELANRVTALEKNA